MSEKQYRVMCKLIDSGELNDMLCGFDDVDNRHGEYLEWIIDHSKLVDAAIGVYNF
jgi:hypothetical protein